MGEFFGNCGENNKILTNSSKMNVNMSMMMDACTQTEQFRGVFIPETEIPKIRYNGKLLSDLKGFDVANDAMSHSAIFWNEYRHEKENKNSSNGNRNLDLSIRSSQSEKISSMHMPMYTPTLRHNAHSIAMYDDDFLHRCSDLDDGGMDSDASMASNSTHANGHEHGNERIPKL